MAGDHSLRVLLCVSAERVGWSVGWGVSNGWGVSDGVCRDGACRMERVGWRVSDGACRMECVGWSESDGVFRMGRVGLSVSDGVCRMEKKIYEYDEKIQH